MATDGQTRGLSVLVCGQLGHQYLTTARDNRPARFTMLLGVGVAMQGESELRYGTDFKVSFLKIEVVYVFDPLENVVHYISILMGNGHGQWNSQPCM